MAGEPGYRASRDRLGERPARLWRWVGWTMPLFALGLYYALNRNLIWGFVLSEFGIAIPAILNHVVRGITATAVVLYVAAHVSTCLWLYRIARATPRHWATRRPAAIFLAISPLIPLFWLVVPYLGVRAIWRSVSGDLPTYLGVWIVASILTTLAFNISYLPQFPGDLSKSLFGSVVVYGGFLLLTISAYLTARVIDDLTAHIKGGRVAETFA